jgi:hypothetical protein
MIKGLIFLVLVQILPLLVWEVLLMHNSRVKNQFPMWLSIVVIMVGVLPTC